MGAETIFVDVDLARNFKALISRTDNVTFKDDSVKNKILNTADDDFLMVTKKIGSTLTLLSAIKVDDALLKRILG